MFIFAHASRAQKFRDRQKALGNPSSRERRGIQTKAQKEALQKKWRIEKQKWRLKINIQKHRRVRERESKMKQLRRLAKEHRKNFVQKRKALSDLRRKVDEVLYFKSSPADHNHLSELLRKALQTNLYRTRKEKARRRRIVKAISPAFNSLNHARKCLGLGKKVL